LAAALRSALWFASSTLSGSKEPLGIKRRYPNPKAMQIKISIGTIFKRAANYNPGFTPEGD